MKQLLITIAAAGMLALGMSAANAAYENDTRGHDAMEPVMSGCMADQALCLEKDMTTETMPLSQSDAEVRLLLGEPEDSITEVEEIEVEDTDETAADGYEKPEMLIVIQ